MDLVYVYMYILLVYIRDWAMQGLVGIGCCCIYGCVCMGRVGWCYFLFVFPAALNTGFSEIRKAPLPIIW